MLKIKRFRILQYLAIFGVIGILSACGGGGGGGVYFDPNVAPKNVQVVAGDDSITDIQNTISWNQVSGATDYRVFWSETSGTVTTSSSVVGTVSSTFNYMTHNIGLVAGSTYYYKVQALSNGTGSVLSAEAKGTPQQAITGENLHDVVWNGTDMLVAVGDSGYIIHSTNGTVDDWSFASVNPVAGSGTTMSGVTWYGNQFLAVGSGGTILTSADGDIWTLRPPTPISVSLEGIVWTGDHYIVAGGSGNIFISDASLFWTSASVPPNVANDTFNAVASNKSVLLADRVAVAVGTNGVILSSNDDGATWVDRSASVSANANLSDVTWDGTQFVVVGSNDTVITSLNGVDWEFQAVGSPDISFIGVTQWDSGLPSTILRGAVGSAGNIWLSADAGATTWIHLPSGTNEQLEAMTYVDDGITTPYFVIVGHDGTVMTNYR
jgi:hypothetical protein